MFLKRNKSEAEHYKEENSSTNRSLSFRTETKNIKVLYVSCSNNNINYSASLFEAASIHLKKKTHQQLILLSTCDSLLVKLLGQSLGNHKQDATYRATWTTLYRRAYWITPQKYWTAWVISCELRQKCKIRYYVIDIMNNIFVEQETT